MTVVIAAAWLFDIRFTNPLWHPLRSGTASQTESACLRNGGDASHLCFNMHQMLRQWMKGYDVQFVIAAAGLAWANVYVRSNEVGLVLVPLPRQLFQKLWQSEMVFVSHLTMAVVDLPSD